MRVDNAAHAERGWRVAEIAPDFELLDAWDMPATGTEHELADLVAFFRDFDPAKDEGSGPSRALFALREKLGAWFGWDEDTNALPIPGCEESSLRERLPDDLPAAPLESASPFRPVFETDAEWAAELSNDTVHAVLQLGWLPDGDHYRGRLGVYVKPRGLFGRVYMALIAPFRHYIVYPALLRRVGRAWARRAPA